MSNEVTNADLLGVLTKISGDIGGLKTSAELQLKALENHATRIGVLEGASERQKATVKVWGVVATTAATLVSSGITLFKMLKH